MAKARKIDVKTQASLSNKMQQLIASLELEGITLSPESMVDVRLFDEGKISKEEFIKRAIGRAKPKAS